MFKPGDIVVLSKSSEYYGGKGSNQLMPGESAVVLSCLYGKWYQVKSTTRELQQDYREWDLIYDTPLHKFLAGEDDV